MDLQGTGFGPWILTPRRFPPLAPTELSLI